MVSPVLPPMFEKNIKELRLRFGSVLTGAIKVQLIFSLASSGMVSYPDPASTLQEERVVWVWD